MERVRIINDEGVPVNKASGIFAGMFVKRFPLLPVEDEGRLHVPAVRENFIERIFALKRWRDHLAAGKSSKNLIAFHRTQKLLLLSHSTTHYRLMGKLVADVTALPIEEAYSRYQALFMEALRLRATRGKQTNVLDHMLGYFKRHLSPEEKQEMLRIIAGYKEGHLPLIAPIILFNHYVRKYGEPYLNEQVYLNPHPLELQLRNHA